VKAAGATYGRPCTRCQQPLLPSQAVEPDHRDGGGPQEYAGWAHASCNHSAGASRGNQLRAQAYRAAKGLPEPPVANGQVAVKRPAPARCKRSADATPEERLTCVCGQHSRCW
jgi:hypothetical protein